MIYNALYTKNLFLVLLSSFLISVSYSQEFTSSNLPIIIIKTDTMTGGSFIKIKDEPKVKASMQIIWNQEGIRNNLNDINTTDLLNYNGRIAIETRGSSSQELAKKGYGFTTYKNDNLTKNKVSILGMAEEKDWILNAIAYDPSYIRDYLCYNLYKQMGNYATQTQYCEVVINNDYKGLYILQEKIKPNKNRVNVTKMTLSDSLNPNITGGYIFKSDRIKKDQQPAWEQEGVTFKYYYPEKDKITNDQRKYISNEFSKLVSTTLAYNNNVNTGYPSVIDVSSFIDYMLLTELSSNADAYQFSTYYHKERLGKLRAGPIWDCNLTFGHDFDYVTKNRSNSDAWQFENKSNEGPDFWKYLFDEGKFHNQFSNRWFQLLKPGNTFDLKNIYALIDKTSLYINEARIRDGVRWERTIDHDIEQEKIKNWLKIRIAWMSKNLIIKKPIKKDNLPKLIIKKINYNPIVNSIEDKSLEFIEIKNTGKLIANLSGVYFKNLSFYYVFPKDALLKPNSSLFLVKDKIKCKEIYGIDAFDEFQDELSNKGEQIILSDAFGNTIDKVEYNNNLPWPDVYLLNGSFISLKNELLDNNIGSSWKLSTQITE